MTYRPPVSNPILESFCADTTTTSLHTSPTHPGLSTPAGAPETRTLLTFPTEGLPSPRIVSQAELRAFTVRYPTGSAPAQTQINRWLCCRCAEDGYLDPVGMIHCSSPPHPVPTSSESSYCYHPSPSSSSSPQLQRNNISANINNGQSTGLGGPGIGNEHRSRDNTPVSLFSSSSSPSHDVCWRPSCLHRKCVNCALYAGPLGREPGAKLLIRTVGGLYATPRFVDPVYWECAGCGEWLRNRFDSRCTLGLTACRNEGCPFAWRAGRAQLGGGFGLGFSAQLGLDGGGDGRADGAGVLTAESVVMNRYGQRLGTADQRVAVAGGAWYLQRRALGDPRCAIVAGLRTAMKRTADEMQVDRTVSCSRQDTDAGRLWDDGRVVPHYPYRRPPPVDENDVEENDEYEGSYLAGISTEPLDRGKGAEQQYTAPDHSPRFCPTPAPAILNPVVTTSAPFGSGLFPGWNHLQM